MSVIYLTCYIAILFFFLDYSIIAQKHCSVFFLIITLQYYSLCFESWGVVQVVECLSSKCRTLSSNPVSQKDFRTKEIL
jgi:hypothetical protein